MPPKKLDMFELMRRAKVKLLKEETKHMEKVLKEMKRLAKEQHRIINH